MTSPFTPLLAEAMLRSPDPGEKQGIEAPMAKRTVRARVAPTAQVAEAESLPSKPSPRRRPRAPSEPELVKVSILAKRSGVPAATIKHYVREGLLPEPTRTSRNMAYYDSALVPRIQQIKELQRTRFLPLKVIKQVLDEQELGSDDETLTTSIARVLAQHAPTERRSKDELIAAGMPPSQLDWLKGMSVIAPLPDDAGTESYTGDDLEILRVLGAARKAGLSAEMLPVTILGEYAQALQALVRAELKLFREGVLPRAGGDLSGLAEAATLLSERLVVLLRRKMLLPTLHALASQEKRESVRPPEQVDAPPPAAPVVKSAPVAKTAAKRRRA